MQFSYSVEEPLNREPPVHDLVSSFFTIAGNYDRNHGPIPHIAAEDHIVKVNGLVHRPLELSIEQLRSRYTQHEIISALQCAGNRRHTMRTLLKDVDGIDWGDGAVMNCKWRGPKLKDILDTAGINVRDRKGAHVAFACYKTHVQNSEWYGGSIELDRALRDNADVLIALEMNGEPLSINHGFPARMIVPGVSGCRSVKWVDEITVQSEESRNLYQRYDYKRLPPEAMDTESAKQYWNQTSALQDMPINSVIAEPQSGDTVRLPPSGRIEVEGYALPQGDQGPVVKVECSTDEGQTWEAAEILSGNDLKAKWCWALWKATVRLHKGKKRRLLSRATDNGGNVQTGEPVWNWRGVGYDGYGESRDLIVV